MTTFTRKEREAIWKKAIEDATEKKQEAYLRARQEQRIARRTPKKSGSKWQKFKRVASAIGQGLNNLDNQMAPRKITSVRLPKRKLRKINIPKPQRQSYVRQLATLDYDFDNLDQDLGVA